MPGREHVDGVDDLQRARAGQWQHAAHPDVLGQQYVGPESRLEPEHGRHQRIGAEAAVDVEHLALVVAAIVLLLQAARHNAASALRRASAGHPAHRAADTAPARPAGRRPHC